MFGVNLSFAVKRWPEPSEWAKLAIDEFGIETVQFSFDLINPFWLEKERQQMTKEARDICRKNGITIHSAFCGLAYYTYNGLMHSDPGARMAAKRWWLSAVDTTAELGVQVIGGPLGGMTVAVSQNKSLAHDLYREQIEFVYNLSSAAKSAGINEIMLEPTPLLSEFPHSVEQALKLMEEFKSTDVPIKFLVDIGHALYQPLYGRDAGMATWFEALQDNIGAFHLQNTDFQSDSHWGWPHPNGRFDVTAFAKLVNDHKLSHLPMFLEVFYPFELTDEEVLANIKSSVEHCKCSLG